MGIHFVNGVLVGDGALDTTISTLLREHQTPDFTASDLQTRQIT
jgi:hypothetical protein